MLQESMKPLEEAQLERDFLRLEVQRLSSKVRALHQTAQEDPTPDSAGSG